MKRSRLSHSSPSRTSLAEKIDQENMSALIEFSKNVDPSDEEYIEFINRFFPVFQSLQFNKFTEEDLELLKSIKTKLTSARIDYSIKNKWDATRRMLNNNLHVGGKGVGIGKGRRKTKNRKTRKSRKKLN
jgi:hypothetical protein